MKSAGKMLRKPILFMILAALMLVAVKYSAKPRNMLFFAKDKPIVSDSSQQEILRSTLFAPPEYHEVRIWISVNLMKSTKFETMPNLWLQINGSNNEATKIQVDPLCGTTIPLDGKNLEFILTGSGIQKDAWTVSILANYRKNTLNNINLSEKDLQLFDKRFNDLHQTANLAENLYEIKEGEMANYSSYMAPFDSIHELEDMLSPRCTVKIIDQRTLKHNSSTSESITMNKEAYCKFVGRNLFMWDLRMSNHNQPTYMIHSDAADISVLKKMSEFDKDDHLEKSSLLNCKMHIEKQRNRLEVTKIDMQYVNQQE